MPCDLCGADEPVQIATRGRFDQPLSTVMCRRCRLVYTSPRMSSEEARRFYEEEYYPLYSGRSYGVEEVGSGGPLDSEVSDTERLAAERLRLLTSVVDVRGKRVLDVGCGTGSFLRMVADAGGEAHGVEVAPDYAEFARSHYGVAVFSGTFEDFLSGEPGKFDIVTLLHVLEHVQSPFATLAGVRSVLEEGGHVCIQVPNVLHRFNGSAKTDLYVFLRSAHLYNFTVRSLSNLLLKTGFRLVTLRHVGPRYLFAIACPAEPAPFQKADSYWGMVAYFRAWRLWCAQRLWRRRVRAAVKGIAFALLGEQRVRRWVGRLRGR